MDKDVEFVCTGNRGRSPLAEAFAKRWLTQKSLIDYVRLSSSGTLVDQLKNPDYGALRDLAEHFVPRAIAQGIITREHAEQLKQSVGVKEILDLVFAEIKKREIEHRRYALEDKGLTDYWDITREPRQTIVRTDVELIFPIGGDNYGRVIEIYASSNFKPRIELLGDIKDPILASLEEFRETVDQTEEAVERVMAGYFK